MTDVSSDVRVLTSLQSIESIRPYWESVQHHPNVDFEHFRLICRMRPEVLSPYVLALGPPDAPTALLVCRKERTEFVPKVGYFSPVAIPANVLTVLYNGAVGAVSARDAGVLVRHLWTLLRAGEADAARFHHLQEDSPLLQAFRAQTPSLWAQKETTWTKHWTLNVPAHPGDLLQRISSKHRKSFRKKERDLESAFAGQVRWTWRTAFEDLPELCARLESVAARTYQRGLHAGFRNDEEHRARFELFARQQQLRVQLLELGGETRAFWIGTVYRGVFHSWATGYDPEIRDFEPGNLMFHQMVDNLAREGVERLDFGLGTAFYKERFGDGYWQEGSVTLFAPSLKGALLRGSVGATGAIDRLGRQFVEAAGVTGRIKTAWRHHLAGRRASRVQNSEV